MTADLDLRAAQFDLLLAPVDEVSLRFTHDGVDGTTLDWGMWVQPHGDPDPGAAVATAVLTPGASETTGTLDVSALELGVDHLVVLRVGSGWAMGRCVRSRLTTVRQVHEVQLSLAEVGVDLTVVVSPGGDERVEVFAAALAIPVPVEDLGGSFDGDTLTVPALDQVPEGVRVLTFGQTDPARDGMWTSEGAGVFSWEVERWQPFRPENAGLLVTAVTSITGDPVRGVIATLDGETFTVDPIGGSDVELPIGMEDVSGLSDALAGKADSSALDGFVPRSSAPLFLSDYADPTGTASASDGMRAALADLAARGGGELVIDGLFLLDQNSIIVGSGASAVFTGLANHVVIRGQGSHGVLLLRGGAGVTSLHLAGIEQLTFENVTFFGSASTIPDCRKGIYLNGVRSATFVRCSFVGIVAGGGFGSGAATLAAVVHAHDSALHFKETTFAACGGQIASWHGGDDAPVVLATQYHGLTAENSRWVDVAAGAAFKGSPQAFKRQPVAWVWLRDPFVTTGGMRGHWQRDVHFADCFFDEGAGGAIRVENTFNEHRHRRARVESCNIATPSINTTPHALAAPLLAVGVDDVVVEHSFLGDFGSLAVGARFEDCGRVRLDHVTGAAPVTTIEADADCGRVEHRGLGGSIVNLDSDAAQTVDLDSLVTPDQLPAAPVWELVEERVLAEDANNLDFTGLDEFAEVEIRWSARCVNTSGSQVPLLARFNGDSGTNYSFAQSGRIVNTNLLSNTTAQNAGYLGYVAASQTNADRWSTGTIWLRCDQPAGSRKVAHGTCVFGQSTGDNIGQADIGLEWANTTDPIETLRLFCSADLVAGSRFTVLGRR